MAVHVHPTQERILALLTAAAPGVITGTRISEEVGVSRAAVSKAINRLRALGYRIESIPRTGHRLLGRADALLPAEVTAGLTTQRLGHDVRWFDAVASTQDIARDLANRRDGDRAVDGTLVIAERQTAGRGRLGRAYESPAGGIWCTLVLHGPVPPRVAPFVSLAAGLAVARAIDTVTGLATTLKWPNDVQAGGRKVTGILLEALTEEQAIRHVLLGTGINANFPVEALPDPIRDTATTLASATGGPVDRVALLQRFLAELEPLWDALRAGHGDPVLNGWRAHRNILGQRVRADLAGTIVEGIATGLHDDGSLIIQPEAGEPVFVTAGDVQALPEVLL